MKNFLRLTTTLILLIFLGGNAWGQTELLVNGGFESWDNSTTPTGWDKIESVTQEGTEVHGGTYSAKHIGGTKDLGQFISVTGGKSYTITMWYKVVQNDGTDARIWSYWRSGGSNLNDHASELRGPNNSYLDNNGGVWTEYTVTLTAPASADEFYFEVRTYSGATVYWDDFSFLDNSASGPADPNSFTATASSTSQIVLSFATNVAGDNVIIVFDNDNTFSAPAGTPPAVGQAFAGGTLLYNGTTSPQNHTGLSAGETWYYKAWSVDVSNEYSTGLTDNATTHAAEPSNHPSGFGATANSDSEITINWTHVDGSQAASDYLILAKKGGGTFASVADGSFVADDADWSNNNAAINVSRNAGTTQSYQFTGLTAGTAYDFIIYPYNGSGATVNYKTDSPPSANASTFGNDTEVYAPNTQIAAKNISSLVDTPTEGESMNVFTITIADQGSDAQPTKVTNIRVKPHTTNQADWTNTIQGVFVDDNSNYIYPTATITDTHIDLAFTSGDLNVADNTALDVTLYIYLNTSGIVDGQILSFMVDADAHGFTADASGSGFASTFLLGDFNSNDMTLAVEASKLTITQQPSNVNVDEAMSPSMVVAFTDANGNTDIDYNGDGYGINLTTTGTFSGSATTAIDATNGVSTFGNLIFSTAGSDITITANDEDGWGNTAATSVAFDVTELPKLIISEVTDPGDVPNAKYIELYNTSDSPIDLSGWEIRRYANDNTTSSDVSLSGTINPFQTFVVAYNATFVTEFGFTPDMTNGYISGNGDDTYELFDGTQVIDIYGEVGVDGTGEDWEYTNSKAVRNSNITSPNTTWTASEWTITAADVADCTPGEHNGNVSWKGGTGNWNTPASWSNGKVPTSLSNVIVPNGATLSVDVTNAAVNNINVQDGGAFNIDLTQKLSVSGTITIEDGGSFINKGTLDNGAKADASAIMQRAIEGYTLQTNGWHLLSSPVNNFTIAGSDFEPGTATPSLDDFYGFDEVGYQWLNYKVGANNITNFINGIGYLVAYETTATKNFTGTFNNTDITFTNLSVTAGKGEGWHLLGNPFQSALQWTNTDWAKTNMGAGAKIMNPGGTYTDLTVGGIDIIPANQGFFVEATTDANNSITIPASQRLHNATAFYKSDPVDMLTLRASDGDFYVETWIQIMDDATADFDAQYDVNFLGGMYNAPYFYSKISESERLSTNRIAPVEESTTIQLAFKSFLNKEFTISADGISSFTGDIDIILEDTQEDIQIDLRETPSYTFLANADELTERFKLHLLKSTGINEANQIEGLNIYTHNNTLYLNSDIARTAQVEMYNVTGQLTFSKKVTLDGLTQITPQLTTGWYVVKVNTSEGMATQKVFIK